MTASQKPGDPDEVVALLVEVARRHTVGGVVRTIVDGLMGAVGSGNLFRVAVWLANPDDPDGPLLPAAAAGGEGRGEELLIGRVAATGRHLFMADEGDWDDHGGYPAWAVRQGVVGYAAVPMAYRRQPIGVLSVHAGASLEAVLAQPMAALRTIADHGAACIANARASGQLRQVATRLELENAHLRGDVRRLGEFGEILGEAAALRKCLEQIDLAGGTAAPVLIRGERGTGKELMARAVHERSTRRRGPFVAVSCASISPDRMERELFGSLRGASPGAEADHRGAFEIADGGTLFLKDVDALSAEVQRGLHDSLRDHRYRRLGEKTARSTNVRLVVSTTRDLGKAVNGQRFREELFHRISVLCLEVPPLRDRADDVAVLAAAFLRRNCDRLGVPPKTFAPEELERLTSYGWPGTVRELKAAIESATSARVHGTRFDMGLPLGTRAEPRSRSVRILTDAELRERERDNVLAALREADWRVSGRAGAAARLDLKPTTLAARMVSMGIERPRRGHSRSS
ncbi:MAG: sigma 54-interacting transcriptional regulator [Gemmatimonadetes bacterium]|nr:sigma 54-interacting transcriptional regulator [Gemmatimonadota bacterium]